MSKKNIVMLAILGVIVIFIFTLFGRFNKMVEADENVDKQWSNVEVSYQRRGDLIKNLVSTVKGYADFEQETLTKVIEARSKATSIQINASDLNAENMKKFEAAQNQLSGALSRLLLTVERYPDLKANTQFLNLQQELTNTENKIGFERQKFNESVKKYNTMIRKFPNSLVASFTGFEKRDSYFGATEGSEVAPDVQF